MFTDRQLTGAPQRYAPLSFSIENKMIFLKTGEGERVKHLRVLQEQMTLRLGEQGQRGIIADASLRACC